jgi:hypothetical protein
MLLTKLAEPVPSVVLELLVVGLSVVAQQTPFCVIAAPPSDVIFPPDDAEVSVIDVTATVVRVGAIAADVVNCNSFP